MRCYCHWGSGGFDLGSEKALVVCITQFWKGCCYVWDPPCYFVTWVVHCVTTWESTLPILRRKRCSTSSLTTSRGYLRMLSEVFVLVTMTKYDNSASIGHSGAVNSLHESFAERVESTQRSPVRWQGHYQTWWERPGCRRHQARIRSRTTTFHFPECFVFWKGTLC